MGRERPLLERVKMRKVMLLSTALTLGVLNPAMAGGPVVVVEETEVVAEKPASSGGALIPLLLLGAILAVALSDDNDDMVMVSDRRLKEDVVRVGTTRLGLGLYRYRYKGLDGVWEGVMAQEVEVMHPGAIRALPMGYKAVNYTKLGLEMKRVA
jgi:hypothetical protein